VNPPRPLTIVIAVLVAILFVGVPSAVDLISEWLWFGEVGYRPVFMRSLTAQGTLGTFVFLVAFAWLAGNMRAALRATHPRAFAVMTPEGPVTVSVEARILRLLGQALAAAVAGLLALFASSRWETWLFHRFATPFGTRDPILGRDVAFYVFTLPFLELVQGLLLAAVIAALVGVAAAYFVSGTLGLERDKGLFASASVKRHLGLLAAVLLLVLAFGAWLRIPALLTSSSGILHGASYVDVHARMPALRVLAGAAVAAAVLAAQQAMAGRLKHVVTAGGVYMAVAVLGEGYAAVLQRFVVAPNEQTKETPYIVHNIAATRTAYALQDVVESELSGDAVLTRADIERNAATLKNVPLWDHQPLLDTFGQIQEIRTYYDFVSVHNDRYTIDGDYRQIMLSARELNSESLPNKSWINEHLTFTHGYGITLGPVNQATPEGLPVLFIKNIPPESAVDLRVTEPSIYYGALSNDHVFVRTRTREFHYPKGDDNVFASYTGEGGVPVGGFLRKLLFSIRFRSLKALLSQDLTPESRILYHRRVGDRVGRIAPFLTLDPDPYLAIDQGRLVWVLDGYTSSTRYPYSAPGVGDVNYVRNSVKATVDAYHGHTRFYLIDPGDPVAATLGRAFPGLLRPLSEMPAGLRERLRYPRTLFAVQANMLATYHMRNPAVFYNKEDQWEVPSIDRGGRPERMEPYYTIMRLPDEDRPEFIQMLPFTPRQKDNLAAWLVARSDGEHYGKLRVFQFPKQKVVFGPRQVVARINQDQVISPQITLWNQQGSEVIQGTLLVIPIEESLIYIRPLYLRAAGGRIPELKRVIVAYQNQIVMEETLEQAVTRIFQPGARPALPPAAAAEPGAAAPASPPPSAAAGAAPPSGSLAVLSARAREHYQRAIEAQRAGDWARYGEEIRKLGEVLEQMRRQP
jgi:uncharacterized membrane protein (UPF0182 family)